MKLLKWFESLVEPFPSQAPTQPPQGLMAFCLYFLGDAKKPLLFLSLTTFILAICEVSLYAILGQMVDWLSAKSPDTFFQSEASTLLAIAGFILVLIPCLVFLQSALLHQGFMGNFPMRVRWQAHRYLLGQSWGFYQHEFSGRVATKVMQTALGVRETVLKLCNVLLFIVVYLVSTIVLVASLNWRLSIPLIIWAFAYIGLLRFFLPRLQAISTTQANSRSDMTGRIVDSYTNIQTLKLFSKRSLDTEYARESMDGFLQTVHPQMRLVTYLNFSVWMLNMILVFSLAAVGLWFWQSGHMSAAAIAVAMSIGIRITGMSHWIMWEVSNLFENIGIVKDGINTLSKAQAVTDPSNAKDLIIDIIDTKEQKAGCKPDIDIENMRFSYTADKPVFDQFSLHIHSGEKLGLLGRSGAGKSTLINLILRFYDIDSGVIKIGGQVNSEVTQDSLRQSIAVVTQDTSLLHRSVRDNIAIGKPGSSDAEIMQAVEKAQAHFIQDLVDQDGRRGLDAHVGERGVTLSGGQRQRIAIARVLLKDAPILILDEATSALDSEVEQSIQENLSQLMQDKTVIAIAHRLSTIASMDRLVVLEEGAIVEQGSHEELLFQGGIYAELWAKQAGGFIDAR